MKLLPWIFVVILTACCVVLLWFSRTAALSLNSETAKFIEASELVKRLSNRISQDDSNTVIFTNVVEILKGRLATATNLIAEQSAKITALEGLAALKTLPLKIDHRNAALARGGVMIIENKGDQNLALTLLIKRAGEEPRQFKDVIVNGNGQLSIGQVEGWGFVSGDEVDFKSAGYRNAKFVYP